MLIPIVTVILAALVTDETISLIFLAGAGLVLVGVYVGALLRPKETEAVEETSIQVRPGVPSCN